MVFVFDLDETICTRKGDKFKSLPRLEQYRNADVIVKTVDKMKELYKRGDTIIIHTARGMLTNNNDLSKVEEELKELTEEWLLKNNVPYHSLIFGKPYADYYIDDKAINVLDLV
jgi:capsule biosynthesis phosphatase